MAELSQPQPAAGRTIRALCKIKATGFKYETTRQWMQSKVNPSLECMFPVTGNNAGNLRRYSRLSRLRVPTQSTSGLDHGRGWRLQVEIRTGNFCRPNR